MNSMYFLLVILSNGGMVLAPEPNEGVCRDELAQATHVLGIQKDPTDYMYPPTIKFAACLASLETTVPSPKETLPPK